MRARLISLLLLPSLQTLHIPSNLCHAPSRARALGQFVLHNTEEDEFLQSRIYDKARSAELPPTMLIGSWHDCFIQDTFADYRAVREQGNENICMRIFEGTHIEMCKC